MNEKIEILCRKLQTELISPTMNYNVIEEISEDILAEIKEEDESVRYEVASMICRESAGDIYSIVWNYSFALAIFPSPEWLEALLEHIFEHKELTYQNLYFLFCQICSKGFLNKKVGSQKTGLLVRKLLNLAFEKCREELTIELKEIPKEERNEQLCIVLVEQFLGIQHGPTKTTLDRCKVLKKMGKEVFIINTAELLTANGYIPLYDTRIGSYVPGYTELEKISWDGEIFTFFQCDQGMPDVSVMEILLKMIMEYKPGMVLLIGGTSLFAGLVNCLVPVLSVSTTPSGLSATLAEYQTIDSVAAEKAIKELKRLGLPDGHIIPGRFTFALKKQTEHVTRTVVGLPEDSFVIAYVGGRLDYEVDDDFIRMMERVAHRNVTFVSMGTFDAFDIRIKGNPIIGEKSINLGFCTDILSRMELCDLYVNPNRKGGGTSAVEAMYKGKPVISLKYGDVAANVGEEFTCDTFEEMSDRILRYMDDEEYYAEHSKLALQRAEELLDSETEFKRILDVYDERMK